MAKDIVIKASTLKINAQLNDSKTAQMIYDKLPIEGGARFWGEEIYFEIPVITDLEEAYARDIVELGDLGYWPQGAAFCIFFGLTPISKSGEIRPASTVNIIGKVSGNIESFKRVKDSEVIIINKR